MSTTTDPQSTSSVEPDAPESLEATEKQQPTVRRKSKAAKSWNSTMKLVRRIHLYSGLFMFPWVLLYGVTGMFFNHPRWFTGDNVQTFVAAEVSENELAQLPDPDSLAKSIVASINQQLAETKDSQVVLTSLRPPQYSGDLTYTVNTEDVSHTVSINPVTGDGEIRTTNAEPETAEPVEKPDPLAGIRRVEIDGNPLVLAQNAVPGVLDQLGLPSAQANTGRRAASLTFSADVDGAPVAIVYNLGNGFISTTPEDAELPMTSKSFLQRLHLSRGFAPHWNLKTLWGLMVDMMFLSMVFWGLSGLLMWWQIKRTRLLGGGFIIASLAITAFFIVGMHDSLTVAGSRRGGGNRGGGAAAVGRNGGQQGSAQAPGRGGNRGHGGGGGRGNRGGGQRAGMNAAETTQQDEDEALFEELQQMLLEQERREKEQSDSETEPKAE